MEVEIDIEKYVYAFAYTVPMPSHFSFQQVAQQLHLKYIRIMDYKIQSQIF